MAEAVVRGIVKGGAEAELLPVAQADPAKVAAGDVFALGCPSMGAEELEESEMEPFVQALEGLVSGKKVLLFGSYGWGDGEWMRTWEERMKEAGATLIGRPGRDRQRGPPTGRRLKRVRRPGMALAEAAK